MSPCSKESQTCPFYDPYQSTQLQLDAKSISFFFNYSATAAASCAKTDIGVDKERANIAMSATYL